MSEIHDFNTQFKAASSAEPASLDAGGGAEAASPNASVGAEAAAPKAGGGVASPEAGSGAEAASPEVGGGAEVASPDAGGAEAAWPPAGAKLPPSGALPPRPPPAVLPRAGPKAKWMPAAKRVAIGLMAQPPPAVVVPRPPPPPPPPPPPRASASRIGTSIVGRPENRKVSTKYVFGNFRSPWKINQNLSPNYPRVHF